MNKKEQDFLDEQISQRTAVNPNFPSLVDEALVKRKKLGNKRNPQQSVIRGS